MDGLSELLELVIGRGRKVYVARKLIDLSDASTPNDVFVLQLPDGSTAAGGRGGGFGERRIVKAYRFKCEGGSWKKVGEYEDDEMLDLLDLPYHATAMPVLDTERKERLVSGVVDPPLAESYGLVLGPS